MQCSLDRPDPESSNLASGVNSHLTMPWWQHTLLMLAIPLAVGIVVVWWKLSKASRAESARPLRKRKRRRH